MKVLEFSPSTAIPTTITSPPHYGENCIAYTGTHDNEPLLSYIEGLDETARRTFEEDLRRECGAAKVPVRAEKALRRCVKRRFAVVFGEIFRGRLPMNDLLCLGRWRGSIFPPPFRAKIGATASKNRNLESGRRNGLKALAEKYQR